MPSAESVVARHTEPGEEIRAALSAYTPMGFGRRVVGVTDRRFLLIRSAYWSVRDKGLLWADPLDQVALDDTYYAPVHHSPGNAWLTVRRADRSMFRINPRSGFFGRFDSAEANIKVLYSVIPGRF